MTRTAPPQGRLRVARGRQGLRLQWGGLVLDGFERAGATFVSYSGVRWPPRASRVIASDVTARLLGSRRGDVLGSPFRRPFSLGDLTLELLPAAFAPGAASLLVERGGDRLFYVRAVGSSFSLRREGAASRRCRTLVFGTLRGIGPEPASSREDRLGALRDQVVALSRSGRIPVLVCSALGAAVPVAAWLSQQGVALRAHRSVHRVLSELLRIGRLRCRVARFEGAMEAGVALLWPRGKAIPGQMAGRPAHPILVAGDAEQAAACRAAGCRTGVALSARANRHGWAEFLDRCAPERVVLPEAPPEWMEELLAARDVRIRVLRAPAQLALFSGTDRLDEVT